MSDSFSLRRSCTVLSNNSFEVEGIEDNKENESYEIVICNHDSTCKEIVSGMENLTLDEKGNEKLEDARLKSVSDKSENRDSDGTFLIEEVKSEKMLNNEIDDANIVLHEEIKSENNEHETNKVELALIKVKSEEEIKTDPHFYTTQRLPIKSNFTFTTRAVNIERELKMESKEAKIEEVTNKEIKKNTMKTKAKGQSKKQAAELVTQSRSDSLQRHISLPNVRYLNTKAVGFTSRADARMKLRKIREKEKAEEEKKKLEIQEKIKQEQELEDERLYREMRKNTVFRANPIRITKNPNSDTKS